YNCGRTSMTPITTKYRIGPESATTSVIVMTLVPLQNPPANTVAPHCAWRETPQSSSDPIQAAILPGAATNAPSDTPPPHKPPTFRATAFPLLEADWPT